MNFLKNKIHIIVTSALLIVLAVIIVVSPQQLAKAATGVPKIISYQGRLTDSSGQLLGGTGTNYFFRFSIWDNPTPGLGTKLWPTAAPGTVTSQVADGVFNVNIGDTANGYPDALTYNFQDNSTVYLQVEVSSSVGGPFETLAPRQQINSSGYAINAGSVLGAVPGTSANNLLQLDNSGQINIGGNIITAGNLQGSSVITNALTPTGALTLGSTAQPVTLQGSTTTITSNGGGHDIVLNAANNIDLQSNTTVTGNLTVNSGAISIGGDTISDFTGSGLSVTGGALGIGSGAILNAMLANPSITINTSGPLGGGGAVALGGSLTITCSTCITNATTLFTAAGDTGTPQAITSGNTLTVTGGTGISTAAGSTNTITITNTGVTALAGTTNQITASASTGSVTLSLPTDLRAPGTFNAVTSIATGLGAGTVRIDSSGNLTNIGNISGSAAMALSTVSGNITLQPAGSSTTGNVVIGAANGGGGSANPDELVVDQTSGSLPAGTNGAILLDSTGKFNIFENGAWKILCNKTDAACGAGSGSALSAISAATGGNTINNGDNAQVWNWALTTNNKSAFTFGENSAASGTGQNILNVQTLSTSTANPLIVTAGGTINGVKVDSTGLLQPIGTGGIVATIFRGSGSTTDAVDLATAEVGGVLGVTNGGTGSGNLASHGILYGNGTSAVGVTTAGTDGQILLGVTSGAPAFGTLSGDATISNTGVLTIANNAIDSAKIQDGSVANVDLANSSITINTSSPLGGGGAVSLGGSLTITCASCITSSTTLFNAAGDSGTPQAVTSGQTLTIAGGTGVSTSAGSTRTVTITNTGVTSLSGTANQIATSASTGAVTLSVPATFIAPGTLNAVTSIATGSGSGTVRIDGAGDLENILALTAAQTLTTNNSSEVSITPTQNLAATGTVNGVDIAPVKSGTAAANTYTLNAFNADNVTGTCGAGATCVQNAFNVVGTNYTNALVVNGTTVVNGSGQVPTTQLTGTLFNAAATTGGSSAISQGNTLTIAAGTAITTTNSSGTITIANTGVTALAGTANQITASASTGSVTLSIPATFIAPGTLNAVTSVATGAGSGTVRIDGSGNLSNIGTISASSAGLTGNQFAYTDTALTTGTAQNISFTNNSAAAAGNTATGLSITENAATNTGNTSNLVSLSAGSNGTVNGINISSATGFTNFLKTPSIVIDNSGNISGAGTIGAGAITSSTLAGSGSRCLDATAGGTITALSADCLVSGGSLFTAHATSGSDSTIASGGTLTIAAGTAITTTNSGTGTITIANTGVTALAGTANQITASASTGSVTLSIPATFIAPGSVEATTNLRTNGATRIDSSGDLTNIVALTAAQTLTTNNSSEVSITPTQNLAATGTVNGVDIAPVKSGTAAANTYTLNAFNADNVTGTCGAGATCVQTAYNVVGTNYTNALVVNGTTVVTGAGVVPTSVLSSNSITVATGTSGTDFNVSGSPVALGGTVTLNIPDANNTTARGVVNTGTQTFGGAKTFSSVVTGSAGFTATTGDVAITAGNLTLNGTTRISNAGVGTLITGTVIGSDTFTTNNIADSGALTVSTTSGNITLQPAGTSTTGNVVIGAANGAGGSSTPDELVVDQTSASLPTGTNGAIILDSTGKFNIFENGAWKILCNKTDAACGAGSGSALSSISAATGGNTINSADNAQVWNWALTTNNKSAFTFGENTAAAGTGQTILNVNTLSGSTANPLVVTSSGTANGIKVDSTGLLQPIGTGGIVATEFHGTGSTTDAVDLATAEVAGTLAVGNGGTGAITFTSHGVLYGNTTSAIGVTAAGTDGQLLLGVSSSAPAFATLSGDATITNSGVLTIANNAVSNAKFRQSAGLSVVGNSTNSTANVADITGTADQVLRVNSAGTSLGFGTVSNAGLTNSSITVATGTSGTDFNVSGSPVALGSTVTLNIPDASASNRGLVTTGTQILAGSKTFSSAPTFSSLTSGSVLYLGISGLVSQDNANFFYDAADHYLALGTTSPSADLTVNGFQPATVGSGGGTNAATVLAVTGGTGGNNVSNAAIAGVGGPVALIGGTGGVNSGAVALTEGGTGGALNFSGGTGGAESTGSVALGGLGGNILLTGGSGGAATTSTSNVAGVGGTLVLAGGTGGNASGGSISNTAGSGGDVKIDGGVDGTGTPVIRSGNIYLGDTTGFVEIGSSTGPSTQLTVAGQTLITQATNVVGAASFGTTVSKNDSNTRTFYAVQVAPTLSPGASNTTTTLNDLAITPTINATSGNASTTNNLLFLDTTNTATTGVTTNLISANYGGSNKLLVDSSGNITSAALSGSGSRCLDATAGGTITALSADCLVSGGSLFTAHATSGSDSTIASGGTLTIAAGTAITTTNSGTGTITIANTGVTALAGTANQITASASTGSVTLSIPATFIAPGTLNAVTSVATGAGSGTVRIDSSGDLTNIVALTAAQTLTTNNSSEVSITPTQNLAATGTVNGVDIAPVKSGTAAANTYTLNAFNADNVTGTCGAGATCVQTAYNVVGTNYTNALVVNGTTVVTGAGVVPTSVLSSNSITVATGTSGTDFNVSGSPVALGGTVTLNIPDANNTTARGVVNTTTQTFGGAKTFSSLLTGSSGITASSGDINITSGNLNLNGTTRISNAGVGTLITGTVIGSDTFTTNNIADSGALTIATGANGALTLNPNGTGAIVNTLDSVGNINDAQFNRSGTLTSADSSADILANRTVVTNSAGSLNDTANFVQFTSNISGSGTDTGSVLGVTQSDASASGDVVAITNSGTGKDISGANFSISHAGAIAAATTTNTINNLIVNGSTQTLSANNIADSGALTVATGSNGNLTFNPNGTGVTIETLDATTSLNDYQINRSGTLTAADSLADIFANRTVVTNSSGSLNDTANFIQFTSNVSGTGTDTGSVLGVTQSHTTATGSVASITSAQTANTAGLVAVGASTSTTLAGNLIGINTDVSTNYTPGTNNVTGDSVTLPTYSSAGAAVAKGLSVATNAFTVSTAATGTLTGVDISLPALTANTSSSALINADGAKITTPASYTIANSANINVNGLEIVPTGTGTTTTTLNGIKIGNITGGTGTETALNIGTGWDNGINVAGTTVVTGAGVVPTSVLSSNSITVATGTSGTDFNVSGSPVALGGTVTLNIPDANNTTARGVVNTGTQTFGGAKTFSSVVTGSAGFTATTGDVAITAGNLTLNGTTRISNAGVGTLITGTVIGSDTFTTNNIADSGALTIATGANGALTLNPNGTGAIVNTLDSVGNINDAQFNRSGTLTSADSSADILANRTVVTNSAGSLNDTANFVQFTSNISGSGTDTGSVLGVTQSDASASGDVVAITNSGTGKDISGANFSISHAGAVTSGTLAGSGTQCLQTNNTGTISGIGSACLTSSTAVTSISGTSNQITASASTGSVTLSIPATFIAPGSVEATTNLRTNGATRIDSSGDLTNIVALTAAQTLTTNNSSEVSITPTQNLAATGTVNGVDIAPVKSGTAAANTYTLNAFNADNVTGTCGAGATCVQTAYNVVGTNYTNALVVNGTTVVTGAGVVPTSVLSSNSITVATGTSGTDFNVSGSPVALGGTVTLNIPDAGASARGLVTTGTQTLAGAKTFSSAPTFSTITSGSVLFAGTSGLVTQDNSNLFYDGTNHRLGVGINSSLLSPLNVQGTTTASGANAIAGTYGNLTLTNSTSSGFQFGNRILNTVNGTVAGTEDGELIRMTDNTTLTNTVRGLEVQAFSGTNTNGTNIGVISFGKTFGLEGVTDGTAGGVASPAGVFAYLDNSGATTAGNAIRAYSDTTTSADLVSVYQETSAFTGNGLIEDLGNGAGSFSGNFVKLNLAGTQKFAISSTGEITSASLAGSGTQCLQTDNSGNVTGTGTACGSGSGVSIGGAVTSGTAGSILFVNPTATLAQDNSNLFYDGTNHLLGLGNAIPATRLDVTGLTINTNANNTVAAENLTASFTKNDTNTRTFPVLQIKPTLNTGGSNTNTTVNVLAIDTTNTATTGLITNLISANYGGSNKLLVDSSGNITSASLTSGGTQCLEATSTGLIQGAGADCVITSTTLFNAAGDSGTPQAVTSGQTLTIAGGTGISTSAGSTRTVTITNTGVTSLSGTTNQIATSASTGAVTLSVPATFIAPGTLNAVTSVATGAGSGTVRIDSSGDLTNIVALTAAQTLTTNNSSEVSITPTQNLAATGTVNGVDIAPVKSGTAAANTYTLNAFNADNVTGTCGAGATCVQTAYNVVGTNYTNALVVNGTTVVTGAGVVPTSVLSSNSITVATGTSGTDFNVSGSPVALGGTVTLNIPDANNTTARGVVNTTTQTFGGAKTFSSLLTGSSGITASSGDINITSGNLNLNGTTRISNAGVGTLITGTVIGSDTFTTNNIADSGALTIATGANGALTLNPNGTGAIVNTLDSVGNINDAQFNRSGTLTSADSSADILANRTVVTNSAGSLNDTANFVQFTSNISGSGTDTGSVLGVTQSDASASGDVVAITNSGTGKDISGANFSISHAGAIAAATTTNTINNLIVNGSTQTLSANNIADSGALTVATGSNGNLTFNPNGTGATIETLDATTSINDYQINRSGTLTAADSLADIFANRTVVTNSSGSLNDTANFAQFTSNISGTGTDTGSVLGVTQSHTTATGSVASITSAQTANTAGLVAVGASTSTTLAGNLIGINTDVSTNYTPGTNNVTGDSVTLPTYSSAGAAVAKGLSVATNAFTVSTAATGTLTGVDISLPALTANTSSSALINADGAKITTPASYTIANSANINVNGLEIVPTGTGTTTTTLNGIKIGNITGGTGTETALNIGTGWDNGINVAGTTVVTGAGVVPTSVLSSNSITVATGTSGTDFNVSGSPVALGGTVTLNIPDANNTTARGLVNTGTQTFGGAKTFSSVVTGSAGFTATTGDVAITAGNLTLNGTTRISNAGVGTLITGTVIGSDTFTTNNIADSGALTIATGANGALTLNPNGTGAIVNTLDSVGNINDAQFNRSGTLTSADSSADILANRTVVTNSAGSLNDTANFVQFTSNVSGTGTDTGSVLGVTQSDASASGAVLSVTGAGTGNIASLSTSNASANGVSIGVQSSSSSQYALNVTANNGSTNVLYARADGNVGVGTASPAQKLTVTDGVSLVNYSNQTPATLGGADLALTGNAIYVSGKFAYLAVNTDSGAANEFRIYDIHNANSPTLLGGVNYNQNAKAVYVSGNYAYVGYASDGSTGNELQIYDISNPSSPTTVGGLDLGSDVTSIMVVGKYLYLTKASNAGTCSGTTLTGCEFSIYDITNPASPVAIGGVDLNNDDGKSVYVNGKYAYIGKATDAGTCSGTTVTGCEFSIFDISNPFSPAATNGVNTAITVNSVVVSGKYAYLGLASAAGDDFRAYDISNPTSISSETGGLDVGTSVNIVRNYGKYVYLGLASVSGNDFRIVDETDPTAPATVGGVDESTDVNGLFVSGEYAYVVLTSVSGNDFRILNLASLDAPTATIGSVAAGYLSVADNARIDNDVYVGDALNVGQGGINSSGPIAVSAATSGSGSNAIAGIYSNLTLTNSTASGFQFGNRELVSVNGTTAGTEEGQFIRMTDNTTLANTVRGMEIQAWSGTNTNGTNSALATFGKTFGVEATIDASAAGVSVPAAVFAYLDNSSATSTGNAIRAYSDTATGATLLSVFNENSAFTGNGISVDLGNGTGSFASGNLITLKNAGTEKMHVTSTGATFVSLPGTQNTVALCHATNGQTNDDQIVDCSGAPSDIAEWYDTTSDVGLGDVVSVSSQSEAFNYSSGIGTVTDPITGYKYDEVPLPGQSMNIAVLQKAQAPQTIIGVVSQAPYQTFGEDVKSIAQHPQRIALNGRVPVNVSEENGQIHAGDYLTPSKDHPGYAAKLVGSGQSIGIALADSNGGTTGFDKILAFIDIGYQNLDMTESADGTALVYSKDLDLNAHSIIDVKSIASLSGNWSLDDSGNLVIKGHLAAGQDTTGTAQITTGATTVQITFATAYDYPPKVVATPNGNVGNFWVSNKTVNGFTINVSSPVTTDTTFDWIALGQAQPDVQNTTAESGSSIGASAPSAPATGGGSTGSSVSGTSTTDSSGSSGTTTPPTDTGSSGTTSGSSTTTAADSGSTSGSTSTGTTGSTSGSSSGSTTTDTGSTSGSTDTGSTTGTTTDGGSTVSTSSTTTTGSTGSGTTAPPSTPTTPTDPGSTTGQ